MTELDPIMQQLAAELRALQRENTTLRLDRFSAKKKKATPLPKK